MRRSTCGGPIFFLTLAIMSATLQPALILFAARLTEVAELAFVLWLVSLVLILLGLRGFRGSRASAVSTRSQGIQQQLHRPLKPHH